MLIRCMSCTADAALLQAAEYLLPSSSGSDEDMADKSTVAPKQDVADKGSAFGAATDQEAWPGKQVISKQQKAK